MKVAFFITSLRSGGAEKQACLLARTLSLAGYDVTFMAMCNKEGASPSNLEILSEGHDITIAELKGTVIGRLNGVRRIIRDNHFDVVFNYLSFADVFGALISRYYRVPLIVGGVRNSALPWYKRVCERWVHNHVSSVTVFNSYSGLEVFASKGFDRSKSMVIHNCIDIDSNVDSHFVRENQTIPTIISIGRFVSQKDYTTALKTIRRLADTNRKFRYLIVGYGNLENEIRADISAMGLSDIVEVKIRPDNIPNLLLQSDVYLSTSVFEGTSNSIMEAMRAALPVVATNVGDNIHLVEHGRSGMLHECGDAESIACSLALLLDSPELRRTYGKRSFDILQSRFSLSAFRDNYLNLISSHFPV